MPYEDVAKVQQLIERAVEAGMAAVPKDLPRPQCMLSVRSMIGPVELSLDRICTRLDRIEALLLKMENHELRISGLEATTKAIESLLKKTEDNDNRVYDLERYNKYVSQTAKVVWTMFGGVIVYALYAWIKRVVEP